MKNIIISGAYINNKGAQSMIFTVVDEIQKRYPGSNISVLVNKEPDNDIIEEYNFKFLNINIKMKLKLAGGLFKVVSMLREDSPSSISVKEAEMILMKTDLIIDISGFALSSKFTRNNTLNYLSHISIAKRNNIPIVLFPQSFGPFDYNKIEKPILMLLIKKYLKYPSKIYAREKEGLNFLKSLGVNNVELAMDTVFQKKDGYNPDNLFKDDVILRELDIKENSVAIIPNVKTINSSNEKSIYEFYNIIIKKLNKLEKNIYLIRHSTEDLNIIRKIYEEYKNDENIYLIEDEYNSIELQSILKQFDYIVASRYHSIVHAYKLGTPALVLGWATKYKELLNVFNQEKYQFDIKDIDINKFLIQLNVMNTSFEYESKVIMNKYDQFNEKSIITELFKNILK